ncbi:unnamed protein product [Closterium sp. NIES-64]|nr:unnamed protein product [Closterium sp. Naga37s-1]CAI5938660.1 unnamed protein product [Closterium sp. NIES-64]CAI5941698.1 unnamed protein product [Closterium sp. NIES-64]CAI5990630.1 unnamed protein product [Closterium sp. NIES-65]CAI6008011.1 unnamed protein product [Closterium sp. NIES-65]
MLSMMVVGSVGLGYMVQGRRDLERAKDDGEWAALEATRSLTRESDIGELKTPVRRKAMDLEEELKRMQQKLDINNYEYKPVPKPKEEE